MENRLKGLRKNLQEKELKNIRFSCRLKQSVFDELETNHLSEEELLPIVLHLLKSKKTGFELTNLFRSRGIDNFEKQNGSIYTFLHRWEQKGLISSTWTSEKKYYALTKKGTKILQSQEHKTSSKCLAFNELFEG
ncbi:PadR family transcriptional regulator [Alkalihalobacillus sp. AL-G]|uniref:PadR family transcriptional regulator n=1 Tax=Alkalihalobacillus sp. AL-G TaxID=2926399 RepID=UPI00272D1AA4|nr:PadR family transcriptional regulator [Alkalihalobacillus sp. AL-G]WLD91739.1 PadR family transcriptional regulator [Alkalihalobacillus sp. AL-G]